MADDHLFSSLEEALETARRKLKLLDPTWTASRSGSAFSYPRGRYSVPFFRETYQVEHHAGEVRRKDGSPTGPGKP